MSNECGQFQIDPVAKAGGFWKQMIEEFKLNAAMIWLDLRLKIQHVSPAPSCFIHFSTHVDTKM